MSHISGRHWVSDFPSAANCTHQDFPSMSPHFQNSQVVILLLHVHLSELLIRGRCLMIAILGLQGGYLNFHFEKDDLQNYHVKFVHFFLRGLLNRTFGCRFHPFVIDFFPPSFKK